MDICTSGRSIPGLVGPHDPCGHTLRIVGYASRKNLPIEACPRCDRLNDLLTKAGGNT